MARMPSPRSTCPSPSASCLTSSANDRSIEPSFTTTLGEESVAHFTTTDGVRIYYESHGTGDPLFLAYGIGGNAGMWRPNVHALAAHHRLGLSGPPGHPPPERPAHPSRGALRP